MGNEEIGLESQSSLSRGKSANCAEVLRLYLGYDTPYVRANYC